MSQSSDSKGARLDKTSKRDRILELHDKGVTNAQIAERLGIAYNRVSAVVRAHRKAP